jgi:elongation factor P
MLNISDLQVGTFLIYNGQPHQLVAREHSKLGRGGAILRSKLKNLISGALFDITFKGNEKLEEADITRAKAQLTYRDQSGYHFMDTKTYEQYDLNESVVGKSGEFLKEGMEVDVLNFNSNPINVNPPIKVDLEVTQAEPATRGNTAQGSVSKPVVLETGVSIQAPIFICVGDIIKVNTETGEYVERVNKK